MPDLTEDEVKEAELIFRVLKDHGSPIWEADLKRLVATKKGLPLRNDQSTQRDRYSIGWAYKYLRAKYGVGRLKDFHRGTDENRYLYFLKSHLDVTEADFPT